MKQIRISDAELVLMEHIWEKEGIRAAQLVQLEKAQMGWSRNTTYTLLSRMVEKEIIRREDPGFCCTALVSKEQVRAGQTHTLIDKLYGGQSVNIKDFGVFSLSARTVGVEKKEDCTAKNIKAVKINFRPSTTIRPDVTATRAGQKIDFYDLEALVNKDGSSSGGNSSGDQGGSGSGEGGLDENPLG